MKTRRKYFENTKKTILIITMYAQITQIFSKGCACFLDIATHFNCLEMTFVLSYVLIELFLMTFPF